MKLLNSRVFQLTIYASYIVLGTTGVLFSYIGWIHDIHNEFYIFFTNQSNIIAIVCASALLVSSIIDLSKGIKEGKENRFVNFAFCIFVYQGITMILYNVLTLDGHIFTAKFWSTLQCPVLHLFAPGLFVFIFIAFTNKEKISKYIYLLILIYPLLYALLIYIRSFILGDVEPFKISGYIRFPYPIFDYVTYPVWLIIIFMILGLGLFIGLAILLRFLFQRQNKKPPRA